MELFKIEKAPYGDLKKLSDELELLHTMWKLTDEWQTFWDAWCARTLSEGYAPLFSILFADTRPDGPTTATRWSPPRPAGHNPHPELPHSACA